MYRPTRILEPRSTGAVASVFCSFVTRLALHSRLIPGTEEAYEIEHARVWPELITVMRAAGISDWSIWRSGRDLFHLVVSDDFEAAVAQLKNDPVDQRWQQHMSQFVEGFAQNPEGVAGQSLRHVWTMSEQTD
ncbi:L-rhamnose mutarotase [Kribbella sp. NPDC003557]|uniref:L-rhamnose mutarotase n=1 Tax=Kribbella sp. NPDC003557 TaxID=3154449 RepID=UPI0033BB0BE2